MGRTSILEGKTVCACALNHCCNAAPYTKALQIHLGIVGRARGEFHDTPNGCCILVRPVTSTFAVSSQFRNSCLYNN